MVRKIFLFALVALLAFLYPCSTAQAQEQQPIEPIGEETPAGGNIYLYLDGELVPVARDITGGNQMVEFAVLELLKGPTEEEKAAGYVTYIPEGVKLQYTTIKQDRSEFSLNLSRELLELSGDTDAAAKALTQIVKTTQEVSGITNIGITVAGEGMGDQPQDAFDALGVAKGETGADSPQEAGQEGGGNTGLVLGIVFGALGAILAAALAVILIRRRKPAADREAAKKKAGKQADRKKAKR